MTTDYRALCAELIAWAEKTSAHYYVPPDVIVSARAALAAPQQGALSDADVRSAFIESAGFWLNADGFRQGIRAVLTRYDRWGMSRCDRLQQEQQRFRDPERTILCDILANGTLLPDPQGTRYGAQAVPVAVAPPSGYAYRYPDYRGGTTIRFNSGCEVNGSKPIEAVPYWFAPQAAVPVAVAERLPGEGDCSVSTVGIHGCCWAWHPPDNSAGTGWWGFEPIDWAEDATHWLPHWALPLPQAEVGS